MGQGESREKVVAGQKGGHAESSSFDVMASCSNPEPVSPISPMFSAPKNTSYASSDGTSDKGQPSRQSVADSAYGTAGSTKIRWNTELV